MSVHVGGCTVSAYIDVLFYTLSLYFGSSKAEPDAELSKEAMARVREKVKEAPLPEGIFYDGRGYIDGFGDWTADHPALEAAVEAEMRALNAEAERCNAALATQHAAAQAEAAAYLGRVQGSIEVD